MAVQFSINEYEPIRESWIEYEERLEYFLLANGITEAARKKAVLITSIGASNFSILRSVATPDGVKAKSFDELVLVLRNHFSPKPSEVAQRFKFNACVRKPGESVASFLANLRSLSEDCNFGESLEVMIRDRIVYGINDRAFQKRLLSETKLTYKRAVELARELETADRDIKLIHGGTGGRRDRDPEGSNLQQNVHKIQSNTNRTSTSTTCYRCGTTGHIATKCRIRRDIVCNACGKVGHIQKACRSRGSQSVRSTPTRRHQTSPKVGICHVQEEDELALIHVASTSGSPPISVEVLIDDIKVAMEVDTGASVSFMSGKCFRELWPRRSLLPTKVRLSNYNKDPIPLLGSCEVKVKYRDQPVAVLQLLVVDGPGPTLFGRNWLSHFVLDWKCINSVSQSQDTPLQELVVRYDRIFTEELGTLSGFKATIHVDSSAQPKFCRPRVVPYALREKVDKELARLVRARRSI